MVGCSVKGCWNTSTVKPEEAVTFFKFPRDANVRKTWINLINRYNDHSWKWNKNQRVCSIHFEPSCLLISERTTSINLRENAIPSLFLQEHEAKIELQEHNVKIENTEDSSTSVNFSIQSAGRSNNEESPNGKMVIVETKSPWKNRPDIDEISKIHNYSLSLRKLKKRYIIIKKIHNYCASPTKLKKSTS